MSGLVSLLRNRDLGEWVRVRICLLIGPRIGDTEGTWLSAFRNQDVIFDLAGYFFSFN